MMNSRTAMDIQFDIPSPTWNDPQPEPLTDFEIDTEVLNFAPPFSLDAAREGRLAPWDRSTVQLSFFQGIGDLKSTQLAKQFPHVIRRIEALWGKPEIYAYLDALTLNDSIPRQGFPPEVMAEVQSLQAAYRARFPEGGEVPPQNGLELEVVGGDYEDLYSAADEMWNLDRRARR